MKEVNCWEPFFFFTITSMIGFLIANGADIKTKDIIYINIKILFLINII